ncbi:MAG: hypothetical protein FJY67_04660 [Calditrichaeota bacterium]|nr:hypothetical protein [Calditrichota bacterium]
MARKRVDLEEVLAPEADIAAPVETAVPEPETTTLASSEYEESARIIGATEPGSAEDHQEATEGTELDEAEAPRKRTRVRKAKAAEELMPLEPPPPDPSQHRRPDFTGSKLNWLVHDFNGVTDSVYEAVMVAAQRARQIGRKQKREIDLYNQSVVITEENLNEETNPERGIDRFSHIKPTVQALDELRRRMFDYHYPDRS